MKLSVEAPAVILKEGIGKYLGRWAVQTTTGGWSENPIDIYWFDNPEKHSLRNKLLGFYFDPMLSLIGQESIRMANVESSFVERYFPCFIEDDIIYISKYRHDFVKSPSGVYIDGGRDYVRSNCLIQDLMFFNIETGTFHIKDYPELEIKIEIEDKV